MGEYIKAEFPQLFAGKAVFVLGGGPSLAWAEPWANLILSQGAIAVNGAMNFKAFNGTVTAPVLFFGDAKWYWWNKDEVQAFPGLKITMDMRSHKSTEYATVKDEPNLLLARRGRILGYESKHGCLAFNRSSGAAAINLAGRMGAKKVILLGFDMRVVDGQRNYVPHKVQKTRVDPYDFMRRSMEMLSTDMANRGIQVKNATPCSALEWFPKITLKEAFRWIR